MKNFVFITLIAISLVSCKGKKAAVSAKPTYFIEDIAKIANAEKLSKTYPEATVINDKGLFEEGTQSREYTILNKDTSDEIVVTWQNGKVYDIAVSNRGKWTSKTGISVGTTYDELVALNGKTIGIYGFGWDYSGAVDWEGGKLEKSGIMVFLAPEIEPAAKFLTDKKIQPNTKELRVLDLKVKSILYQNQ